MTNNTSLLPPISLLLSFVTLITLTVLIGKQSHFLSFLTAKISVKTNSLHVPQLRDSATFLPLKDLRFRKSPNIWFMSSVNDTHEADMPKYLYFPSASSKFRILCLSAHHRTNGTKNFYSFASPNALPYSSTLLRGLTVVSDTHFDYINIWHGLSTIVPFVAWHEKNKSVWPERWVLFHWGELRTKMGHWVKTLAEATIGSEVKIENFEKYRNGPVCFERAVVFRRNDGGLSRERREQVYDMMRCKARHYCKITANSSDMKKIRVTLLLRTAGRAFKDETAVIGIFNRECRKLDDCVVKIARPHNLTFCDQVKLLSETDILISAHGAQMTNMIFMDKNSSVLEFFPKGWLEFAGVGQYVFQWMAKWAGMRHRGQWRDQEGIECPYDNNADCFAFYKDGKIGHDEAYFSSWMASVLKDVKQYKLSSSSKQQVKQNECLGR